MPIHPDMVGAEAPTALPDFAATETHLALPGAAGSPVRVEGESACLRNDGDGVGLRVDVRGVCVARGIAAAACRPVNVLATPGTLRREFVSARGTGMERWIVPLTLPLVAAKWSEPGIGPGDLEITLLPDDDEAEALVDGAVVVARGPADQDRVTVASLIGASAGWRIVSNERGVTLRGSVAEGSAGLVLASGSAAEVRTALKAVPHLMAHETRANAAPDETIRVRTGVSALDDAVEWACLRVSRSIRRRPSGPFDLGAFWTAWGAIAGGDTAGAEHVLDSTKLDPQAIDEPGWPLDGLHALLAARVALSGGRSHWAISHAEALLRPTHRAVLAASGREASLWRTVTETLADGLMYAWPDADIARIRGVRIGVKGEASKGRRLPMASSAGEDLHFLTGILNGRNALPDPTGREAVDEALQALGAWDRDRTAAWNALRRALAAGLERGPGGPGTWDASASAPAAGILVSALVQGAFGWAPDAPSGRLTLAPRLPGHLNSWSASGFRVGETTISCRYERAEGLHRFELEPTFARVPPVVVFEPTLSAAGIRESRVDGESATLDHTPVDGGVRPRIQVALDAVRSVEFVTD